MKEAKCYSDLIDVAENNMLDNIVLENFTNNTSIASTNDKNLLHVDEVLARLNHTALEISLRSGSFLSSSIMTNKPGGLLLLPKRRPGSQNM